MRVDGDALTRDGIEGVLADGLEESVRKIDALDVAAAEPAEITDADTMENCARAGILIDDVAHGRRTDEETVVVVMEAAVVFVVGDEKFGGVAREKEILQISVYNGDLLAAALECVQAAVGIFFEEIEVGGVVFDFVVVKIAEDADAGLFVLKEETAEVGVEFLSAGANGNEIVVRAEIAEFVLDEGFLKAKVRVEAIGAAERARARRRSRREPRRAPAGG